jgi:competence protein ComEA
MNWKRMTLTALLTLGLTAIPALAQDTSSTTTTTTPATTKTKQAMKKAGEKTKWTAETAKNKVTGKKMLDLNTATKDELAALPGMTPDEAQKIIDSRPYRMKSQLESKDIIPKAEYAKIKGDIIAKQNTSGVANTTAKTKAKHTKKPMTTTTTGPS